MLTKLVWFISQKRTQRTKFENYISTEETVTAVVPQAASLIGPKLFIYFVNDLPGNFRNCKIMYDTDDTQILVLEDLLKTAQAWYSDNSKCNKNRSNDPK